MEWVSWATGAASLSVVGGAVILLWAWLRRCCFLPLRASCLPGLSFLHCSTAILLERSTGFQPDGLGLLCCEAGLAAHIRFLNACLLDCHSVRERLGVFAVLLVGFIDCENGTLLPRCWWDGLVFPFSTAWGLGRVCLTAKRNAAGGLLVQARATGRLGALGALKGSVPVARVGISRWQGRILLSGRSLGFHFVCAAEAPLSTGYCYSG